MSQENASSTNVPTEYQLQMFGKHLRGQDKVYTKASYERDLRILELPDDDDENAYLQALQNREKYYARINIEVYRYLQQYKNEETTTTTFS
jgi:hypothetical protein